MNAERLELAVPAPQWETAYLPFVDDFVTAGESSGAGRDAQLALSDFAALVRRLEDDALGIDPAPDRVPSSQYWLLRRDAAGDVTMVGVSYLRHTLTPTLEDVGGHIGYSVRPSERRRGYGTRILALTLPHARALGLARVLVTCDTNNIASARVIEKNGGVLASEGYSELARAHVSRYWITL
jgi:predicted acetyltransferase